MTKLDHKFDAHARPPEALKAFYKRYQKLKSKDLEADADLVDFHRHDLSPALRLSRTIEFNNRSQSEQVAADLEAFVPSFLDICNASVQVYELDDIPGTYRSLGAEDIGLTAIRSANRSRFATRDLAEESSRRRDPSRCFRSKTSEQSSSALQRAISSKRAIILFCPAQIYGISMHTQRSSNPQANQCTADAEQETSMDHTRWTV